MVGNGGSTQMELVTTLELSHGSGTVVDHQLEANRARDFNKRRSILVPAFSRDIRRLASNPAVVTIITIIISSGHMSPPSLNRREHNKKNLVFEKCQTKIISVALSLSLRISLPFRKPMR